MVLCMHSNLVRLVAERVWMCLDCRAIVAGIARPVLTLDAPRRVLEAELPDVEPRPKAP
jgi:ribosomal protein L37AE/L43A